MAAPGPRLSAALLAAAALAGASAAHVQADDPALAAQAEADGAAVRRTLSLDQAVLLIEQRYHGRVVRAQTERDEGRTLYVMRVLDEGGHVWSVRVDADSGAVL